MASRFVHLHVHSHYSLLDGLAKVPDIISRVKETGMEAIALTDHGVLYGIVEFYKAAKKAGIKPILGLEAYVAPKSRTSRESGDRYYHLILLAENQQGWKNLIQLSTKAHLEGYYYKPRVDRELLREHHEGIIALSACLGGEIGQTLLSGNFAEAVRIANEHRDIFGPENYFLEIQKHPHLPESEKVESDLIRLSRETGVPLVATQDSHYVHSSESEYHDVLLAVQTGNQLSDDDRLSLKTDDFSILSPEVMMEKFSFCPEAIENTVKIAERCQVDLELGRILLPDFPKPDGKDKDTYLRELVNNRAEERYPSEQMTKEVRERIDYELDVIQKTGFADYFLIVQDFINWAKARGIAVGPGRGSAAGSIVSYILRITDIDPLKYDLLFERFLNPERIQMPDIDMDFADTRRDEVLAYVREKYGSDRVAQIITFGTMAARAAIRDAGRAMGFSYSFCDQIAKLIPLHMNLEESVQAIPELKTMYESNSDAKKLIETARHLEGVARHASVHACGTVISKDPLPEVVPLQNAPQNKDIVITQFEMHAIEDMGLLKMDFLGLRNLTTIQETVRLVAESGGERIDMTHLPLDDAKTYALLQRTDNTGIFQFESAGMRRYMKDIKPTSLEDLIALVALYRPGPMELIPSFIKRKNGKEKITYLHPKLEPILKNTYGIGVYQEQMMRIARDLAGYSLAEADTLRKAIGKKIKALLDEQEVKLVQGMVKNDIPEKTARQIWDLFPPFARYGFNKSHAACYALIGYQTAYLKAHYPIEFMTSLLNGELSDIERIAFLVHEGRETGIQTLPPDVNMSFTNFTPEGGGIRFGLLGIKNVGAEITKAIIEERARSGPFQNFSEFLSRVQHKDLNKKSLESMIKAGVFDSFGIERNQALQNMEEILKFTTTIRKGAPSGHSLFGSSLPPVSAKLELKPTPPADPDEKLRWEKELLGFYLSDHPMKQFEDRRIKAGIKTIAELCAAATEGSELNERVVGQVSQIKKIITKAGQPMIFATLEDMSQKSLEVVVFNSILTKTATVWNENAIVVAQGRLTSKDGTPKFLCENAKVVES